MITLSDQVLYLFDHGQKLALLWLGAFQHPGEDYHLIIKQLRYRKIIIQEKIPDFTFPASFGEETPSPARG